MGPPHRLPAPAAARSQISGCQYLPVGGPFDRTGRSHQLYDTRRPTGPLGGGRGLRGPELHDHHLDVVHEAAAAHPHRLWYTANGFGIALGGLLGFGIGQIRGALPSWKYEFIIIGSLCCLWGLVLFLILPDSPVTAGSLSPRERRIAVERMSKDQTGVENKTFKRYQLIETLRDPKTYFFFLLGALQNTPNGGISNFGTLIIQGFGFSTLVTTLMQVPYGMLIALSILSCVYLNDYFSVKLQKNVRCWFAILYLLPNIAGTFGLRFVPTNRHIARLWMYYLTGPYNAAFVLVLSLSTANTAGHTKKVATNAFLFLGYCVGELMISNSPYFFVFFLFFSPRYKILTVPLFFF